MMPEQDTDTSSLEGRVIEAGHGTPVAGAAAALWAEGRLLLQVLTDAAGAFRVKGLSPGRYEVRADKPGYRLARRAAQLEAGQKAEIELALTGTGSIAGRVLWNSHPVANAAAHAVREGVVMGVARTRADGAYHLADLPPGRYDLVAQTPRLGAAGTQGFSVEGGEVTQDVVFEAVRAPSPLSGRALRQGLAEIWAYRHLVYNLVLRDMRTRYKASALGLLWSMLLPLAMIGIYTVVFKYIMPMRGGEMHNFTMVLFCALVPWLYFMSCVGDSCSAILSNGEMIRRVRVPPAVFPMAVVFQNMVHFFLMLIVFVVVLQFVPVHFFLPVIMLPVLVLLEVVLLVGLAFFLSALNTFYHDVAYVVSVLLNFLLFLSPILYPAGGVLEKMRSYHMPEWLFSVYMLNPVAILTASYRDIFLGRIVHYHLDEFVPVFPHAHWVLALAVEAAVILVAGYAFFIKSQSRFSDVL